MGTRHSRNGLATGAGRASVSGETRYAREGETRYARSGDVHIAYRVFGNGPRDIILVPGTVSHVELYWELPINAYMLKRLASLSRVIVFDRRGQGLSDRVAEQSLEERVSDVRAVMDAAGSKRATVYGWSEGGQMSLAFAARYPERVSGLVLYGAYASVKAQPWAVSPEQYARFLAALEAHWGQGFLVRLNAPGRVEDEAFVQWFARLERAVASPSAIVAMMRANYEIDVSGLLPSIRMPALLFHRTGDALVPVEAGRCLARKIAGARYVELSGDDHMLQALDQEVLEDLLDQVEEFITGRRCRTRSAPILSDAAANRPAPSPDDEGGSAADEIAELERCRELLASADDGRGLAGVVARAQAVEAAARGSWKESEQQFIKAAETFRRHGMVWQEARTFQSWGRALQSGTDRRAALEKHDMAIEIYHQRVAVPDRSDDVEDSLAHANGRGDGPAAHTAAEISATPPAVFRQEGEYWTVSWQGKVVRLKNAKGLHYIAYLLANPSREVAARDLAVAGAANGRRRASSDAGRTAADLGDAGALLDATAREQYRRRICDLRQELAEAVEFNDTYRAERLRGELESLGDQIAAATGLGGRDRRAASHSERARLMVTKAIRAAIAKVRASDAALGRHLATSVKTGNYCAYDPDPALPVSWQL